MQAAANAQGSDAAASYGISWSAEKVSQCAEFEYADEHGKLQRGHKDAMRLHPALGTMSPLFEADAAPLLGTARHEHCALRSHLVPEKAVVLPPVR